MIRLWNPCWNHYGARLRLAPEELRHSTPERVLLGAN